MAAVPRAPADGADAAIGTRMLKRNVEPWPGYSSGCQSSGKIVRVMMFHSSLTWIG